jgi:hypothetical protein
MAILDSGAKAAAHMRALEQMEMSGPASNRSRGQSFRQSRNISVHQYLESEVDSPHRSPPLAPDRTLVAAEGHAFRLRTSDDSLIAEGQGCCTASLDERIAGRVGTRGDSFKKKKRTDSACLAGDFSVLNNAGSSSLLLAVGASPTASRSGGSPSQPRSRPGSAAPASTAVFATPARPSTGLCRSASAGLLSGSRASQPRPRSAGRFRKPLAPSGSTPQLSSLQSALPRNAIFHIACDPEGSSLRCDPEGSIAITFHTALPRRCDPEGSPLPARFAQARR